MEFGDLVHRRRMIRKFAQKPVPDDLLKRVLEVARHAPSGGFSQGFDFVVLTKPAELQWFYRTTDNPTDPDHFPEDSPMLRPAVSSCQLRISAGTSTATRRRTRSNSEWIRKRTGPSHPGRWTPQWRSC